MEFNEAESDEVRYSDEEILSEDIGRPREQRRDEERRRGTAEGIEYESFGGYFLKKKNIDTLESFLKIHRY